MTTRPDIKALVFDLDQTLIDSWEGHRQGVLYAAERANRDKPSSARIVAEFCGILEEHLERLFGSLDRTLFDSYVQFYQRHHLELSIPFPGISEALKALKSDGYKLAVLSNKLRNTAEPELETTGMAPYFDAALFRDEGYPMKPDPDGLLRVLQQLQVSPEETLFVGDAPDDVRCAKQAGAVSVAALWGALDIPALLATDPHLVWHSVADYALTLRDGQGTL